MSRGRILVIRGGAIGDFILTLPALAALRKQFRQTHIAVLGYPQIAGLAALAGYADEVRSIEARPLAGFFARRGDLDPGLGEWFAGFNIIVSYLYDPDGIFQENIARVSKAQFIAGQHRPKEAEAVHATDVFLKPLERLAIFGAEVEPRIRLNVETAAEPTLVAHPGSGSVQKNWPETRWRELLQRIAGETNWKLLLVGGEAEGERVQKLAPALRAEQMGIFMNRPLTDLAAEMARATAFVGHDSGITHLAAAVGLRGVALWGATKAEIWRPRSDGFEILHGPRGLAALPTERVFQAVRAQMQAAASGD